MSVELLFNKGRISAVLDAQEKALREQIEQYDSNRLLNTSVEDLVAYFTQKLRLDPPVLQEAAIEADEQEAKIDVSHDPMRAVFDRSGPVYIPGTEFSLVVPFEGEAIFFDVQPQSFSFNPPRGEVRGNQLIVSVKRPHDSLDPEQVKQSLLGPLNQIKEYLVSLRKSTDPFNAELPGKARDLIENRRRRLLAASGIASSLGFPMKRRAEGTLTYSPPEVKRRIAPQAPVASSGQFKPEPALSDDEYKYILRLITNSMEVLERSPRAYAAMGEEDLRTQILVMLNSHYEGQATGETFNFSGKTDILVRSDGGNVFVAECKFWDGPKKLTATIDQLMGYVTWRDTKTAVVVFNRNKSFSEMKEAADGTMTQHPLFKRRTSSDDRHFQGVFAHPNDRAREMIVTLLCFDIPSMP